MKKKDKTFKGAERQAIDRLVEHLCYTERKIGMVATRIQDGVVLGPVVYRETKDGTKQWYTIVSGGHDTPDGIGFHCDQIGAIDDKHLTIEMRDNLKAAFEARGVAVTVFDGENGELEMAKYCAEQWPCAESRSILDGIKRERFQDEFSRYAEELPAMPIEEYMEGLASGKLTPGVAHIVHRHEHWCRSQTGGTPEDCDCNPDITLHVEPTRS
jgi:hypothetical protein